MRILVAFLFALSLLSLGVSFLALRRAAEKDAAARRALAEDLGRQEKRTGDLAAAVRELSGRIGSLEARADASRPADSQPAGEGARPEPAAGGSVDDLAGKVGELDAKLRELEEKAKRPTILVRDAGSQVPETEEARREVVAANQPVATDRARPVRERLEALRNLRFRDGRSREVTQAMIELIQDPALDHRTRADIIRNLHGVDFPELKPVLLQVLESDTHVETRSETVETLEPYYGDPAVHATVARVAESDPDLGVRAEALSRLGHYDTAFEGKDP